MFFTRHHTKRYVISIAATRSQAHPRTAAPPLNTTLDAVDFKLRANDAATRLAFCVRTKRNRRSLKPRLFRGGRFAIKSAKSIARMRLRIHPQNLSTGFKSGDLGGNFQSEMPHRAYAALQTRARRNVSVPQRIFHGPRIFPGFTSLSALSNVFSLTARAQSSDLTFRSSWNRTTAKPPSAISVTSP